MKIKGCAQVNGEIEGDSYSIFTYEDNKNSANLQLVEKNGGRCNTWWRKDQIAGENNENFTPFHLWFEYEDEDVTNN